MDFALIEDLIQLEKLATPEPWLYESNQIIRPIPGNGTSTLVVGLPEGANGSEKILDEDDARFIAKTRNVLPELLGYLEETGSERTEAINLLREVQLTLESSELHEKVDRFLIKIGM